MPRLDDPVAVWDGPSHTILKSKGCLLGWTRRCIMKFNRWIFSSTNYVYQLLHARYARLLSWPHTETVEKWCFRFQYARNQDQLQLPRLKKNMRRTLNETPRGTSRWNDIDGYSYELCYYHGWKIVCTRICRKYSKSPKMVIESSAELISGRLTRSYIIWASCPEASSIEQRSLLSNTSLNAIY